MKQKSTTVRTTESDPNEIQQVTFTDVHVVYGVTNIHLSGSELLICNYSLKK